MKAALLYNKDDLRLVDIPKPVVGQNDVLLEVKAAKICPTDIRKYRLGSEDERVSHLPMNLCHEFTGEVVEVGANVTQIKKGTRLVGAGMAGNAEYALLDSRVLSTPMGVLHLPDSVSFEEGTFVVPLSENMHCVLDQAACRFGDIIVIVGAGQMGIMQANIAKACGATVIVTDLIESRLEIAKELGADHCINAEKENLVEAVKRITKGKMADSAIATLGNPRVIQQAIDVTCGNRNERRSKRIVIFGGAPKGTVMQFNPNDLHYSERVLVGSSGLGLHPERREQALERIASGKILIKKIISRIMPLEEIVKAYEMIEKKEVLSIVLIP